MYVTYDFDKLADRSADFSKKWCPKQLRERFGDIPEDYISMWIADMDFEIAEPITRKFKELVDRQTFGYIYCYDDFFQSVQKWNEAKTGVPIDVASIGLNYGVVSTLFNIVQAYCTPHKDSIIINTPVYGPFRDCANTNDVKIVENALYVDEFGRYQMDFALLEEQMKTHKPKVYIFCSPHNPSGRIWSKEEVVKVAALCLKYNILLVADEVHSDHILKGPHYSTLSLEKKYTDNLIFLNSANKGFNFAGLKTSYSIIPCKKIKEKLDIQLEKNNVDEPNVFGIAGIVASYTADGRSWLDQCYGYITRTYQEAYDYIVEMCPSIKLMKMESSYLLWMDVTGTGMDGDTFVKQLALEKGVLFQEGSTFGVSGKDYVRVNIGTSKERVMEALKRMYHFVEEHKAKGSKK